MPAESARPLRGRWRVVVLVSLLGVLAHDLQAQGGPPLVTDDPGTPGGGHVELNLSLESDRVSGATAYDAPRADLNVGVGARVQLKAEVAWRVATSDAVTDEAGLGNLDLGVKWRFVDHGEEGLAISTFPQLGLPGSHASVVKGVADSGSTILLPIEIAWPAGPVRLNADAGWEHASDGSTLIFGLAGSRLVNRWLELLGECHAEGDTGLSEVGVLCGAGARAEAGPAVSGLVALEWGTGAVEHRLDQRIYGAVQLRR